jgi:hypothetical protein
MFPELASTERASEYLQVPQKSPNKSKIALLRAKEPCKGLIQSKRALLESPTNMLGLQQGRLVVTRFEKDSDAPAGGRCAKQN